MAGDSAISASSLLSLALAQGPLTSFSSPASSSSAFCLSPSLDHSLQSQLPSSASPTQPPYRNLNSVQQTHVQLHDGQKSNTIAAAAAAALNPTLSGQDHCTDRGNPFSAFANLTAAFNSSSASLSPSQAASLSLQYSANAYNSCSLANSPLPALLSASNTTSTCSTPLPSTPATAVLSVHTQSQSQSQSVLSSLTSSSSLSSSANSAAVTVPDNSSTFANIFDCSQMTPLADSLRFALQHWLTSTQSFSPFTNDSATQNYANGNCRTDGNTNAILTQRTPWQVSPPVRALLTHLLPKDSPLVEELRVHCEQLPNPAVRAPAVRNDISETKNEYALLRNDDENANIYGLHEAYVHFRANEERAHANATQHQQAPVACTNTGGSRASLAAAAASSPASSVSSPQQYDARHLNKDRELNINALDGAIAMNSSASLSAALATAMASNSISRSFSAPGFANTLQTLCSGAATSFSACPSACVSACNSPRFPLSTANTNASTSSSSTASSDSTSAATLATSSTGGVGLDSLGGGVSVVRYCVSRSRSGRPPRIRKRRFNFELNDREKWYCPNPACGKYYKRTSSTSITKHLQECAPHLLATTKRMRLQNSVAANSATATENSPQKNECDSVPSNANGSAVQQPKSLNGVCMTLTADDSHMHMQLGADVEVELDLDVEDDEASVMSKDSNILPELLNRGDNAGF